MELLARFNIVNLSLLLLAGCILIPVLSSCERPNSPSFETEQVFTIPVLNSQRYPLLGGSQAIIDTTLSDFENRFEVDDQTGLIALGFEEDFPVGSFGNVLPELETSPIETSSSLTRIVPVVKGEEEAGFEQLTGLPAESFPAGTQISGGTSGNVSIELGLGGLQSAIILEGGIVFELENRLGLHVDELRARFFSGGQPLGNEAVITSLQHGESEDAIILLNENDVLQAPTSLRLTISWGNQFMQEDPESILIRTSGTDDLAVIEATASFGPLQVLEFQETEVDVDKFTFQDEQDFVDVNRAVFNFSSVVNQLDVDIDTLVISFPGIFQRSGDNSFHPADTLKIVRSGENRIRRSSHPSNIGGQSFEVEYENLRIFAPNNIVKFTVSGVTENTEAIEGPDRFRTIQTGENVEAVLDPVRVRTNRVRGMLTPRFFVLGDDVEDDADVDLKDDEFNQRSDFDALEFLSSRLGNLELLDTEMELTYESNIGVENRVYVAVLGRDASGNEFLLKPLPGSPYAVSPQDSISGILYDGVELQNSELITFQTEPAQAQKTTTGVVTFTNDNMQLSDFISRFPVETFLVGKALANPLQRSAILEQPLNFDAMMRVKVPFSLATTDGPAEFTDSLEVSLSGLPDRRDDLYIAEAVITVGYANRLPLDIDMSFRFLDAADDFVTDLPATSSERIRVLSAPVDAAGFSTDVRRESVEISLTEEQLDRLNQSERLVLNAEIVTRDFMPVSLRARDFVEVDLRGRFVIRSIIE